MRGNRNLAWAILALLVGLVAFSGFRRIEEKRIHKIRSSPSEIGDDLLGGESESAIAAHEGGVGDKLKSVDAKTHRPRRILSEIELKMAQKNFAKIRERYQPAHPVSLDAENRVAELQAMVESKVNR